MALRSRIRLTLVLLTAIAGGASAFEGNLGLAILLLLVALLVCNAPTGRHVTGDELADLIATLRAARDSSEAPLAISTRQNQASVWPSVMFVRMEAAGVSRERIAMILRDEVSDSQWRELATLLRHQPSPHVGSKKDDQLSRF